MSVVKQSRFPEVLVDRVADAIAAVDRSGYTCREDEGELFAAFAEAALETAIPAAVERRLGAVMATLESIRYQLRAKGPAPVTKCILAAEYAEQARREVREVAQLLRIED